MAEADQLMEVIEEQDTVNDAEPIMPHRVFDKEQLDRDYPPLVVPEAVDAGDQQAAIEAEDPLLKAGEAEARRIMQAAEARGRRR